MKKWFSKFPRWLIALLAALFLVAVILFARLEAQPKTDLQVSDLTPISLDGVQRILVLAPHTDDETMSSGGLILAALQAGIQVKVVVATNGDGYMAATVEKFRKIRPTTQDYIHMGETRQQESRAALAELGIPPENIFFLSYPDRGTRALWNTNWSAANPYKSPYSGETSSPYPLTYNPDSVYAGEDYLADLTSILKDYRPDLVIYPHPDDVHPDHWGLNVFTRLALTELSHRDPSYQPKQLTYLVHRPDFPVVRGLFPATSLVPPASLYAIYPDWLRWDLTPYQIIIKGEAIRAYKTQLPLLGRLMLSFVRANELFAPVTSTALPTVSKGNPLDPTTWQDASGQPVAPVQRDPTGDVLSHKAMPGTDLTETYAARTPSGELWMCARLHAKAMMEIRYSLRLKSLTENGIRAFEASNRAKSGQPLVKRSGNYFCAQTRLADLGNPWAVFLGATVESPDPNIPFDQTAWQMIYIQP